MHAASELGAEPHLIRVHMREVGPGIGFGYFGYQEFIKSVLSNATEWNSRLIEPKTFSDYVKILRGRVSQIRLDLDFTTRSEHKGEKKSEYVSFDLKIDGHQPYAGTIDPGELILSTIQGDEYEVFTCSCGVAGCAGIWRGVVVVHDANLILWKAFYAKGRKVFLFDKEQYKAEILGKCSEVIEFVRSREDRFVGPWEHSFPYLEKLYCTATESKVDPKISMLTYTPTPDEDRLDSM